MKIPSSTLFFIGSLTAAVTSIIAANMWCFTILSEVNGKQSEKDRISLWELRGKLYHVLRVHAELYPHSPKRRQMWALVAMGAVFLFGGFLLTAMLNSR
jgi:hypothetical protein